MKTDLWTFAQEYFFENKKRQFHFWTHYQATTTRTSGYFGEILWQERTRVSKKNILGPAQGLDELKPSTYREAFLW